MSDPSASEAVGSNEKISASPDKSASGTATSNHSGTDVPPSTKHSWSNTSQKPSSGAATPQKKTSGVASSPSTRAKASLVKASLSNGSRVTSQEAMSSQESGETQKAGPAQEADAVSQVGSATSADGATSVDSRSHSSASVLISEASSGASGMELETTAAVSTGSSSRRREEIKDLLQELDTDVVDPRDGFRALDDLFTSGKINEIQYKDLQRKHKYLQSMFWSCLQSRSNLREEIAETGAYLAELKERAREEALTSAAAAVADDTSELHTVADLEGKNVDDLKKYLSMFYQQRKTLDNSIYQIRFKTRHMQEEKDQLQAKIDAENVSSSKIYLHSPTMLEKEIRELSGEIRLRKQEMRNLKEDIATRERLIPQRQAKMAKIEDKIKVFVEEKEELLPKQVLVTRDADRETKLTHKLRKQLDGLNAEVSVLIGKLKESNDATQKLETLRNELIKDMDKEYKVLDAKSKECTTLSRDTDRCRERSTLLMDEKNRAETRLTSFANEIRQETNAVRDMAKAVERVERDLRNAEETVKVQSDQRMANKNEMDKLARQLQQQSRAAADLPARRRVLQKEVDAAHAETASLATMTLTERQTLQRLAKERAGLIRLQETLTKQLDGVMREHSNLIRLRDTNARVYRKLVGDVEKCEDELRNRVNVVGKFNKKYEETEKNSHQLGERYEMAKKERDEMSAQLNISLSNCDELQKKIEILRSQQDTMLSRKLELERQHALTRAATMKCILDKTMIQSTTNQERDMQKELEQRRDQLDMMISCNQMTLNALKESIMADLETYKKQVVDRNERGLLLVEREEEVCAFQEKISLQQLFIDRGYAQLDTCEKDIKELNKIIATEKHHIQCLSERQEEMDGMQAWLAKTRCEMRALNNRMLYASDQVETPARRQCRLLAGRAENPPEAAAHLDRMQLQLYEAELRLLERQLVAAQADRLVERARADIDSNRADAERLAKRATSQARAATASNRRMMASAAEVAVAKSEARRLCEQQAALQKQLALTRERVAAGLPPQPGDRPARPTAAVRPPSPPPPAPPPRPTQYMPQAVGALPVSRPYGAFGPFKPQTRGGRFRQLERLATIERRGTQTEADGTDATDG